MGMLRNSKVYFAGDLSSAVKGVCCGCGGEIDNKTQDSLSAIRDYGYGVEKHLTWHRSCLPDEEYLWAQIEENNKIFNQDVQRIIKELSKYKTKDGYSAEFVKALEREGVVPS